jgi:hypothetical protein
MAAIVATVASDTRKGLDGVDPLRCAQILGMTGVAASMLASDGSTEVVWRTDGASASLEDLQFTVGEVLASMQPHRGSWFWSRIWPRC